jgi:3-oxocholest-4-en-26-oyl-CoA dehydrogenase beta subunit
MDFAFTEEQEALTGLARRILEAAEARGGQDEAGAGGLFDRGLWGELAAAGLLAVGIPEDAGGGGGGMVEVCSLLEEVGRSGLPVPVHAALVLGALPLARFGTGEQRAELLAGVASGDVVLTTALPETALDDPSSTPLAARTGSAGWRVDGVVPLVPAADVSTRIYVPARTEDGVGVFEIDPTVEGVEITRQQGSGGEATFRLTLEWAPAERTLGRPEDGSAVIKWAAERAAVGYCALQVGLSERALRMTAEYTSGRIQFDRPLATFQAVQQRAADAYVDVEAMRVTMWHAAWRLGEGLPAADEVAVAKFWASEGGQRVAAATQHLHGGMGVDMDYPLHRFTFWSKQLELALGGANRQLARVGRSMAANEPEGCR